MTAPNKGWLRYLTALLRIAICAGLLGFVLRKTELRELHQSLLQAATHPRWVASGIVMTFLGLMVGAFRWQRILGTQGIGIRFGGVVKIFFIGQFFNAFMLGACGGDVIRAYYAAQGRKGRRAEAATTVLLDRAIGLLTTILFCCIMILFRMPVFLDNDAPRHTGLLMVLFLLASVIGLIGAFRQNLFERFAIFRHIERNTPMGPLLRRVYEAVYMYRYRHGALLLAAAMSMFNLAFLTLACWCFSHALELPTGLLDHVTLFPIITVLMALPITPGSLGVRESLFVSLFRSVMVSQSGAIMLSLMVYASGLFWSAVGGLLYLTHRGRHDGLFAGGTSVWQGDAEEREATDGMPR